MLTATQYEAIGRLAIAFNEIDYMVETYLAHILRTPEWSVASLIAQGEKTFHRKAELFKDVLKAIRQDRPAFEYQVNSVLDLLGKAGDLARKRNDYIHGLVVQDFKTNQVLFRIKRNDTVFNEVAVATLASEATVVADQLNTECGDLLVALGNECEPN